MDAYLHKAVRSAEYYKEQVEHLRAELAEAKKINDRLPKTADGAAVIYKDLVWMPGESSPLCVRCGENSRGLRWFAWRAGRLTVDVHRCYSTHEAAEAARVATQQEGGSK